MRSVVDDVASDGREGGTGAMCPIDQAGLMMTERQGVVGKSLYRRARSRPMTLPVVLEL